MAYSQSVSIQAPSGSTLKWSIVTAGVLHATLRNQTSGFYQTGTSGLWEWLPTLLPDNFRGAVAIHTHTAANLASFTTANTLVQASFNPGDTELIEKSVAPTLAAIVAAGTTIEMVSPVAPDELDDTELRLTLTEGDDHTSGILIPKFVKTGYVGPPLSTVGSLRLTAKGAASGSTGYEGTSTTAVPEIEVAATVAQVGTTVTITAPVPRAAFTPETTTWPPSKDQRTHRYQVLALSTATTPEVVTVFMGWASIRRRIEPASGSPTNP